MTGVIFAAGIGSRLKPFTDFHPKALAEVHGEPAVVGVARKLLAAGADRLIINIHHFPEQIVECIGCCAFASKVTFSDESALLLDTGGALAKIAHDEPRILDEGPVVVHNADIYTDFPIEEMVAEHKACGADATILVAVFSSMLTDVCTGGRIPPRASDVPTDSTPRLCTRQLSGECIYYRRQRYATSQP